MSRYDQLPQFVAMPDPRFEEFLAWAAISGAPELIDGTRTIRLPIEGFKLALKTAYTAGKFDQSYEQAERLKPEDFIP